VARLAISAGQDVTLPVALTGLFAMIAGSLVAWLMHAVIGDHVSFGTDFALGTLTGGVAYVATFYWLKKLRRGS
jgi:hypothetical protein